jgi:hypothetical protein
MLSRGFTGVMPDVGHRLATSAEWWGIAAVVALPVVVAIVALLTT